MRITSFLLGLTLIFALSYSGQGQNLGSTSNLQNVNVDDLSDEQIESFAKKAQESGYSEQQLELLAKARGMSASQIAKLRQRMNKLGSSKSGAASDISRIRTSPDVLENRDTTFDPFKDIFPIDTVQKDGKLPIFGMSFFSNENLTFEPSLNIPTPSNYLLGSGDQLVIDVWGASEQTYQLTISPEGSVVIPNIGPVYLNGLSIEKAELKLKSKLKSIYSTLGQNTFAQVSLGQIRTISVNVIGEVKKPGTYQLSSFATAFNALYMAGGPGKNGSLREILVFRNGKKIGSLDAYKFLIDGEGQNVNLQDQDVVLVKPYKYRVGIDGEVKRPAYYEVLPEESMEVVLNFAGGFAEEAYTKSISLRRNELNFKTVKTVLADQFGQLKLQNGDFVEVGKISGQYKNRVRIEGAVNHPGEFEYVDGMKLSDLFLLADGIRADAFMEQALIIRQNDDLTLSNIAFRPSELNTGNFDVELKQEDLIKVQSIFDLKEKFTLTVEGEVRKPGSFPFVGGVTVENLIYLAGGFKETAAKSFVEVARRISDASLEREFSSQIFNFPISETLNISSEASTFELKPFDLVVIRKSPFYEKQSMVEIEGEVQFPGKYALEKKNERISDVLRRSGDLTAFSYPKGAILIRRSEYFVNDDKDGKVAARIRKEELQELFDRDTLVNSRKAFKSQESIGIQLEEIVKNPGSKYDLLLKEGDVISIPRELQTVRVRGQVLYPSTIRYDNAYSLVKFVSQAGGFSDQAQVKKSYVVYANGTAAKTSSFLWFKNFPNIEPGAEIIVPSKPEKRKLTPGEIVGLSSGLTTMAWVVFQIINTK
ncbi:MAG: protein involved in polysaccharide export with SLBB domain [Cyclobacteriaceae bacterium]|jgi:protein involved in polysaccharide export with SLBB domain